MKKLMFLVFVLFFTFKGLSQCTGTYEIVNGVNEKASDLLAIYGTTYFVNTDFVIHDDFYIDNNLTFTWDNCRIIVDPNVKIIVSPGATLRITSSTTGFNSHLSACTDMWWGIDVISAQGINGSLFTDKKTLIEDAINAVYAEVLGIIRIDDTEFNKNYRGIYLNNISGGPNTNGSSFFVTNSRFFTKDNSQTNCYCLQSPYNGQRAYAGIEFNKVNPQIPYLLVGDYNNGNKFENLDYGVFAYQSASELRDNNFDIHNTAIHFEYDGKLHSYNNEIDNSNIGIYATLGIYIIRIDNNQIKTVNYGIYIENNSVTGGNNYPITYISRSTFDDITNVGITIINHPEMQLRMHNNYFYNTPDHANIAAYIAEIQLQKIAHGTYYIYENEIYNYPLGITNINLIKPNISRNYLELMPLNNPFIAQRYGIKPVHCLNPIIANNKVTSDPSGQTFEEIDGYAIDYCYRPVVMCNETGNVGHGFSFAGFSPNSRFLENTMYDCWHQFYLYFNFLGLGNVGGPAPSDNKWIGAYNELYGAHTFSFYSNDPNSAGFTKFHVKSSPLYYVPYVNKKFPIQYDECTYSIVPSVGQSYCGDSPDRVVNDGIEDEYRIINADWTNYDEYEWIAKYYLYERVKTDTSSALQDSLIQHVADSLSNTNIGLIYKIKEAISNLPFDTTQTQAVQAVLTLNNSLNPAINIETNIKDVNDIYLNTLALNILPSPAQIQDLDIIANYCHYSDGWGVFAARTLLSIFNDTVIEYNSCLNYSPRYAHHNITSFNNFIIYPNPATDFINLSGTDEYEDAKLEIYDLIGKRIYSEKITSDRVNISNVIEGFYIFRIVKKNAVIKSGKISIMR